MAKLGLQPADGSTSPANIPSYATFQLPGVKGHLREDGLDCFEDFETEAEADAFAEKLLTAWPHLRD